MLRAVEFVLLVILNELTVCNNPSVGFFQDDFVNQGSPINILAFLQEHLECRLQSVNELREAFLAFVPDEVAFFDAVVKSLEFNSLDMMIDYIESFRLIVDPKAGIDPNSARSPYRVCPYSILGLFVRSFLVKWDAMSFEYTCLFQTLITDFARKGNDDYDTMSLDLSGKEKDQPKQAVQGRVEDTFLLEADIHELFDLSECAIPVSHFMNPSIALDERGVTTALQSFISLEMAQKLQSSARHQHAMLSLASLWARNGHNNLAFTAIEETMKIAHQKGDHASVAKALLLLHHIVDSYTCGDVGGSSVPLDESVLIRCLERCIDQKMGQLSAQAAVSLALLQARRPLRSNYINDILVGSQYGHVGVGSRITSGTCDLLGSVMGQNSDDFDIRKHSSFASISASLKDASSVHALWLLIAAAQLGDAKFMQTVAFGQGKSDGVSAARNVLAHDQFDGSIFSSSEISKINLPACIASVALWSRMGCADMAKLQCLRAIRRYCIDRRACEFIHTPDKDVSIDAQDDLATLCCMLATIVVDRANLVFNPPSHAPKDTTAMHADIGDDDLYAAGAVTYEEAACKLAKCIVEQTNDAFADDGCCSSESTKKQCLSTHMHVTMMLAIQEGNIDRALRLALRKRDTGVRASQIAEDDSVCGSSSSASSARGSISSVRDSLMLAAVLSEYDRRKARRMLHDLGNMKASDTYQVRLEASALSALWDLCDFDTLHQPIMRLRESILRGRLLSYPTTEALASQLLWKVVQTSPVE